MTADQIRELARLAVQVALEAPLRPNRYTYKTGVPVTLVADIRAACEAAGIDWRKYHAQSKPRTAARG